MSLDHRGPRLYLGRVAGRASDGVGDIGAVITFIGDNQITQGQQIPRAIDTVGDLQGNLYLCIGLLLLLAARCQRHSGSKHHDGEE